MESFRQRADEEILKLGQMRKAARAAESGVDAKEKSQDGIVSVNGGTETRRGRKLYAGDVASCDGREIKIEKEQE